jgi:hypothetical protein
MKKLRKAFGITALAAVIGLALAGCPNDTEPAEKAATPTANPAGGTYTAAQSVTLSSSTSGTIIYYTLDGTEPTTTSTVFYSGTPINISGPTTLRAIATKSGMDNSNILTEQYAIGAPPPPNTAGTPIAVPPAGTYSLAQSVTLSSVTAGASIYYTTDGSTPIADSTPYSAPISISATTTLKAIALKPEMTSSEVLTAVYTISSTGGNNDNNDNNGGGSPDRLTITGLGSINGKYVFAGSSGIGTGAGAYALMGMDDSQTNTGVIVSGGKVELKVYKATPNYEEQQFEVSAYNGSDSNVRFSIYWKTTNNFAGWQTGNIEDLTKFGEITVSFTNGTASGQAQADSGGSNDNNDDDDDNGNNNGNNDNNDDNGEKPGDITLPASATALSDGVWKDDELSAGGVKWYSFTASGGTYYIYWSDKREMFGDSAKTGDVQVSAYLNDKTVLFSKENWAYLWSQRKTVSGRSGTVYLKVEGITASESGSYAIRYDNAGAGGTGGNGLTSSDAKTLRNDIMDG